MKVTQSMIREYLGHNGHECRVRITRDNKVHRIGSGDDPFDRGRDFWAYMGTVDEIARELATVREYDEYELA